MFSAVLLLRYAHILGAPGFGQPFGGAAGASLELRPETQLVRDERPDVTKRSRGVRGGDQEGNKGLANGLGGLGGAGDGVECAACVVDERVYAAVFAFYGFESGFDARVVFDVDLDRYDDCVLANVDSTQACFRGLKLRVTALSAG
ncbi:hypothetical protein EK21DRAFT_84868 [Setomelanomma holmii]|uniref:Uncharacterized protein n=1 Tax=Setomelanomma holmii TaxID=210430 RepID=A0A9P4LS94_9PLEO|nr:hypothetical protein EK21DRAFT_84868 [Setomelanomma holmii]